VNIFNLDPKLIDPNVAYLVLVAGLWLGVTAVYTPGTGFLEGLSGMALVGGLILLSVMPTNLWAVLLIVVGVLSFHVIPFLKPRFARVAVGGLVLQALGGISLFNGLAVPWILIAFTIVISLFYHFFVLLPMLTNTKQTAVPSEDELLVGSEGRVLTPVNPIGTVRVRGESWSATSDRPLKPGEKVVVLEREGLQLFVEGLKQKRAPKETNEETS
jgi:membrane-bound serine protease (ClpP class)